MATIKVATKCPMCGAESSVECEVGGYRLWQEQNVLIQRALPELSADERERLMTGICNACWSMLLKEEDA